MNGPVLLRRAVRPVPVKRATNPVPDQEKRGCTELVALLISTRPNQRTPAASRPATVPAVPPVPAPPAAPCEPPAPPVSPSPPVPGVPDSPLPQPESRRKTTSARRQAMPRACAPPGLPVKADGEPDEKLLRSFIRVSV